MLLWKLFTVAVYRIFWLHCGYDLTFWFLINSNMGWDVYQLNQNQHKLLRNLSFSNSFVWIWPHEPTFAQHIHEPCLAYHYSFTNPLFIDTNQYWIPTKMTHNSCSLGETLFIEPSEFDLHMLPNISPFIRCCDEIRPILFIFQFS